ncbi:hypothetical protein QKC54_gp0193 [Megavirus baoshan]|uniref:Uncharacterized protein n=1 Tax=Megavirus baoshan TaxID=2496520 RepID=A0A8K1W9G0_9VIRU|nr:hypothetical protein QKC54_gp0193 [Megavirus baoshan]UFX99881.1 hypothetical protein Mb0879 [Megavirus baoshan]
MSVTMSSLACAAYRSAVKTSKSMEISQLLTQTHGFIIDLDETRQEFVYRERRLMAREIFQQIKMFNDTYQDVLRYRFYITTDLETSNSNLGDEMLANLHKINYSLGKPVVYCQGGYYRDFIAGVKNFNDIDLKFPSIEFAELFVKYCITGPCVSKDASEGYTSGCISIELSNKEFEDIKLQLDLGYFHDPIHEYNQHFDMDVNMLVSTLDVDDPHFMDSLQVANPDCDLETVLDHCLNKSFVVFSQNGKTILEHEDVAMTAVYNEDGLITDVDFDFRILFHRPCIGMGSRGRKLKMRIDKMQKRGWIQLNAECKNPQCVLASGKLMADYNSFLERRNQERLKIKIQRLKNKQQQLQDSILMSMSRIPGYIPRKTVNRMSYESRVRGHKKDLLRKELVKAKKAAQRESRYR